MSGIMAAMVQAPASSAYDPDAAAWFAAMTVQPDATRKGLYNTFVVDMKAAGLWALTDLVYIFAAPDAQIACLNGKAPATFVATPVNSPTFTADRGYQGDGSTSYLSTGFAANQSGSLYSAQNSAALAAYSNAGGNGSRAIIGDTAGAELIIPAMGGKALARIHAASGTGGASNSDFDGFYAASRLSSGVVDGYKDAVTGTNAVSSSSPTSNTIYILSQGSASFYNGRAAFAWVGGGLTSTQVGDLRTNITTFLTAIGAD